jgi:metal-responsive CopG/Arc/MetJ family transcriptional regulator
MLASIVMATSVHLPKPLLDAVDRRARALKISRNRLIVKALERELANTSEWSSEFFQALETVDSDTRDAMDELLEEVRARRTSKGPPKL